MVSPFRREAITAMTAGAGADGPSHRCCMDLSAEDLPDGITKVVLQGRFDTTGAVVIELPFNKIVTEQRKIIVDLSAVNFLASYGMLYEYSVVARNYALGILAFFTVLAAWAFSEGGRRKDVPGQTMASLFGSKLIKDRYFDIVRGNVPAFAHWVTPVHVG